MKFKDISDLGMAGILLLAAFILSIPFILGYKSIPEKMIKKRIIKNKSTRTSLPKSSQRQRRTNSVKPKSKEVTEGAFEDLDRRLKRAENEKEWKVVFSDKFNKNSIGEKWMPVKGKWDVSFGKLKCYIEEGNQDCIVMAKDFKLPEDYRISYDAITTKAGLNDEPCDMSLYVYVGDPEKLINGRPDFTQAYMFRVASMANTITGLSRPGDYLAILKNYKMKTGVNYHIVCQKLGDHLKMEINGREIFHGKEVSPKEPDDEHRYWGFYTYMSDVSFDNVEVSIPK